MITTGISSALLKPQTFHILTYLNVGRSLVSLPQRLLLVAPQASTATAVVNAIVPVDDPALTATQFGAGSPMDLMCKKAFATAAFLGSGPALFACPIAEGATTKEVRTLTFAGGPTTADGDVVVRLAGRYIRAGIASGTSVTNVGVAVDNASKALAADLAWVSSNATGVVSYTATTKGVIQSDAIVDVVSLPAGITAVWAIGTAGVGAIDIQPALDAMAGQQFDACAVCTHDASSVTKITTALATRFSAAEKKPTWFVIGEAGSIATATGMAANHEGILIFSMEQSRSLPFEIAAANAVALCSKSRPNANYDGLVVPLYPSPNSYSYTNSQIETALNAGLTPLTNVVDPASGNAVEGQCKVVRMITTRTTLASQPFSLLRDVGVSRSAWYLARQYDIAYAAKFGGLAANPDGVLLDADTIARVRDMVININKAAEDARILRNVDNDVARLIVETDGTVSGRLNIDNAYTIVVGLHQLAILHRAQV